MSKHVIKDFGCVKRIPIRYLITYITTVARANDCGRRRCWLSPWTDN